MSLSNLYIPAFYFQGQITDKDTGYPLANGLVYFYKDQARTILKPVYQISGSPPNYSFTVLPNPIVLSSIGTFQDNLGNDIVPYFLPYDSNGNTELYYIRVYSSTGVFQFDREGEPYTGQTEINASLTLKNYIPNGQFLVHNDTESYPYPAGQIPPSQELTVIAPGGWGFERTVSASIDYVTFEEFGSYVTNPTQSPRYNCRVRCTSPNMGDTRKWLKCVFGDVNKFASDTQYYTLTFSAISNSASIQTVQIVIEKYYGVGGSPTTYTTIQTINIDFTAYQTFNVPILFGNNVGKTIVSGNDSVSINITMPPTSAYDLSFTDFSLTKGNITLQQFPVTTNEEFIAGSLFPNPPLANNHSIGLPLIYTPSGCKYDDSQVGLFFLGSQNILLEPPPYGMIYAMGQTLDSDGFSLDGIPYSRLQLKWADEHNFAKYGNGYDYVSGIPIGGGYVPFALTVHLKQGTATPAVDGAIPTGFTFTSSSSDPVSTVITCNAGNMVTPGSYFTFTNSTGGKYAAYFVVDGIGNKPSLTSIIKYIPVIINSSDLNTMVAYKTLYSINGAYLIVPDLRGYFPRFQDGGKGVDPDANSRRASAFSGLPCTTHPGDFPGTEQYYENASHYHGGFQSEVWDNSRPFNEGTGSSFNPAVSVTASYTQTGLSGGNETRPSNIYFSALVKL